MRFLTLVFSTIQCYMGRIFREQKDIIKLSFLTSVLNFFGNTRMLSIRIQFVLLHWAYAYELYAYAQHTLMNCMRMLSIRIIKNTSKSYRSYTYAEHTLTNCMLIIHTQFVSVCLAYAYDAKSTLSIGVENFFTLGPKKVRKALNFIKTFLRLHYGPKMNRKHFFFFS